MLTPYLIVAVVAYLLGSIPFGYILVKLFLKQDIRQTGSGNIGATNVARSGSKGLAIATLVLDAAKGFLAVSLTFWWLNWAAMHDRSWSYSTAALAALCAIIGHCFPVWLRFKGGKGVATGVGAFAAFSPVAVGVALLVFVLVLFTTRFVSLSSIISAAVFPVAAFLFTRDEAGASFITLASIASALIIAKHHSNIRRLLNGTEHKFGSPKIPIGPIQTEKNA